MIDPAELSVREDLDRLDNDEYLDYRRKFSAADVHSLCDALPLLCSTPRVLKHALRTALDTWERLSGEIDLDDLLAMSILREAQPNAFALMRQHVGVLRQSGSDLAARAKALAPLEAALSKLELEPQTRQAIDQIIRSVFDDGRPNKKPQGLSNNRDVDYWKRFLAVPTLTDAERDQLVLRVLEANDDDSLLNLLEDVERSDAVENLSRLIATDRLKRIFVPLVRRRSVEDPSQWREGDPPGLIPLWRMWQRRSEQGELDAATVLDEVRFALSESVPQNLYLAARIEQFFVVPSRQVHDMLWEAGVSRARDAKAYLRELVTTTFEGKPDALVRALKGASPPTLLWICWGIDRVRAGTMSGLPFPSWPNLAKTILEAAQLQPDVLLPQIAYLVARESVRLTDPESLVHQYEFSQEAAEILFGDANAVLDAFARCDLSQSSDNRPVDAMLVALRSRSSLSNLTTD